MDEDKIKELNLDVWGDDEHLEKEPEHKAENKTEPKAESKAKADHKPKTDHKPKKKKKKTQLMKKECICTCYNEGDYCDCYCDECIY